MDLSVPFKPPLIVFKIELVKKQNGDRINKTIIP